MDRTSMVNLAMETMSIYNNPKSSITSKRKVWKLNKEMKENKGDENSGTVIEVVKGRRVVIADRLYLSTKSQKEQEIGQNELLFEKDKVD